MNTNFRNIWGLTLILLLTSSGLAEGGAGKDSENKPVISVLVHNYAEIPSKMLMEAEEHAARIFSRAGAELVWLKLPRQPGGNLPTSCLPAA